MAPKGTRYLYRVVSTRDHDATGAVIANPKPTIKPLHDIREAAHLADELQNRGARVTIGYIPVGKTLRDMHVIQHLDTTGQPPADYRLCPYCGGAFPVDLDVEGTVKPFTTHSPGGKYEKCGTEIGLDEIDEAYQIDAHHGEETGFAERAAHRMHSNMTPVAWRVYIGPQHDADGTPDPCVLVSGFYEDARNRRMAREDYDKAVAGGVEARLARVMPGDREVTVATHVPPVPGEALTGDGKKGHVFHLIRDAAARALQPWRAENEKIAAELERIIGDPASYDDHGAIDPTTLTRRVAALRAL